MPENKQHANRIYRLQQKKIAFKKLGNVCASCFGSRYRNVEDRKSDHYLQIDHIVPIRRGGDDLKNESGDNLIRKINKLSFAEVKDNYQLLCLLCHTDKTKKDREQNYLSDIDYEEETRNDPVQASMFTETGQLNP